MVKQLGRPAERDGEGNKISKSLVNVTIPTKLRDFLSDNNINRSQLFTRVVTMLYCHALCPKCYETNIIDNIMAIRCDNCDVVIKYHNCSQCGEQYNKKNLVEAIKGSSDFGCESCQHDERNN